ncbi:MAG: hypothetical protein ACRDJE_23295 [Dehalococcoidia bacterium]
MATVAFEGVVENGQIRLRDNVTLPEHAKVYVVVPDLETTRHARIVSPRLVHPEHAADFAKEIVEVSADAGL